MFWAIQSVVTGHDKSGYTKFLKDTSAPEWSISLASGARCVFVAAAGNYPVRQLSTVCPI